MAERRPQSNATNGCGPLVLVLSAKPDRERALVRNAWVQAGGEVLELDRFWQPPALPAERVRIYGPDTFGLVLAQILGLSLVEPPVDFLTRLPAVYLGRRVGTTVLRSVSDLTYPCFIKPLVPKQFQAAVHQSPRSVEECTAGLPADAGLLVSDVVHFAAEARCFCVDGAVVSHGTYEGEAASSEAAEVCARLLRDVQYHDPVVIDLGLLDDGRWVVVEANAAWGAGLNGCDADAVLPAIVAATRRDGRER